MLLLLKLDESDLAFCKNTLEEGNDLKLYDPFATKNAAFANSSSTASRNANLSVMLEMSLILREIGCVFY